MAEEIKQESSIPMSNTKFCKYCGQSIDMECIICTKCGKQRRNKNGVAKCCN